MRPQILCVAFLFFIGCAAAEKAALVGMVTLAQARTDGVTLLMKADKIKQTEYLAKISKTINVGELSTLREEYKKYNSQFDKALLGFEDFGKAIAALKDGLKAGLKLDLIAALKAYDNVKAILADMGLRMPAIPEVK